MIKLRAALFRAEEMKEIEADLAQKRRPGGGAAAKPPRRVQARVEGDRQDPPAAEGDHTVPPAKHPSEFQREFPIVKDL